jgi:hypothetical protein
LRDKIEEPLLAGRATQTPTNLSPKLSSRADE